MDRGYGDGLFVDGERGREGGQGEPRAQMGRTCEGRGEAGREGRGGATKGGVPFFRRVPPGF